MDSVEKRAIEKILMAISGRQTVQFLVRNTKSVDFKVSSLKFVRRKVIRKMRLQKAAKTTAGAHNISLHRMKMSEGTGKISEVTQSTQNLMKKQQNMKKLHHKAWDNENEMYIKSSLTEEPTLKLRMCLDIWA